MDIYIQAKQAGRKKDFIAKQPLTVPDNTHTLESLISAVVWKCVEDFNKKDSFARFLTGKDIAEQSAAGKVGFGENHNDAVQQPEKAVETALRAFRDGLFIVMLGDTQLKSLEEETDIKDGDTLTFLRLVMLAGRLW